MFVAAFVNRRAGCHWGILGGPLMGFLQWKSAHPTGGLKLRASFLCLLLGNFPSVRQDSYAAV